MPAKGISKSLGFDLTKVIGVAAIAVGGLDLAFGQTNAPILPAPLANMLNQQIDILLIGGGAILVFVNF
jgi:hypothetical protein